MIALTQCLDMFCLNPNIQDEIGHVEILKYKKVGLMNIGVAKKYWKGLVELIILIYVNMKLCLVSKHLQYLFYFRDVLNAIIW